MTQKAHQQEDGVGLAKFHFCLPRYHTNAAPWARILQAAGHLVTVDVVEKGPTESYADLTPTLLEPSAVSKFAVALLDKHSVNSPRAFPGLTAYWRRMRLLDPDVVVVRGVTRWFCRVAAFCALMQGRRLVIYDQEDVEPPSWRSTWLRRAAFRVIGVPHFTSRLSNHVVPESAGSALPLPFGCPLPGKESLCHRDRPLAWPARILMVAKYRDRKGHAQLLHALSMLGDLSCTLTMCGEEANAADTAFRRRLESMASELGVRDRVQFRCNIPYTDMVELYAAHDLFILPSRFEPAAVSPIEAVWSGCAALISRDSGTRGYLPRGASFDFDPLSSADIARAISGVLASPYTLAQARMKCFEHLSTLAGDRIVLRTFESFLQDPAL